MVFSLLDETLRLIEFDHVLEKISLHCFSTYGKNAFKILSPAEKPYERLERGKEFFELLLYEGEPPTSGIHDLSIEIERASSGSILSGQDLRKISSTLKSLCRIKEFIEAVKEKYPEVWKIAENLYCERGLVNEIEKAIDENGNVKDNASPALKGIRRELTSLTKTLRTKLDNLISQYQENLTSSNLVTREGRYVLPLLAARKNLYEGIIHGASASGATVYFEPKELVSLNDRLKILYSMEEEEIHRILRNLTQKFFLSLERLKKNIAAISELDVLYAAAIYAKKNRAIFIFPNTEFEFDLINLRHPLIPSDKVVPIDFQLPPDKSAVIITGPNTGGKTVALKNIGLAVALTMCGLPVQAANGSKIPYFDKLFADIGDEQSIEQSLSTFSSHMSRIVKILENADRNTLVLLDELGAGTDPVEGAGLSMAIIDKLLEKKCKSVITTHLSPLKMYAMEKEKVLNASVEFDVESLKPTYHLIIGVPGSSNAIQISRKLGLSQEVVKKAQSYLTSETVDFEKLISKLHRERSTVEKLKRELLNEKQNLKELKKTYEKKLELLKKKRYAEVSEELKELEEKVTRLMSEIENAINLSRSSREKDKVEAVKKLQKVRKEMDAGKLISREKTFKKFKTGETVKIIETGLTGEIIDIDENRAIVKSGRLTLDLPLRKLEHADTPTNLTDISSDSYTPSGSRGFTAKEIDIRGMVTEDVPFVLDKFINELLNEELRTGYIIHGKGTGKLAEAVWRYLRKSKKIKTFRVGTPSEGGHGVTVIEV
ncbi:endonuclease MutS2 [Kosmotoga sp. DU53]|uniref:endonuclease MutS2 n=1 Tax=Kosmotoga sp. DU53 TaxID=1310160 RepID=UPI0007C5ADF2|nr:endonuclease MutS2 [Kosmotoga sp. DU53]OAA19404.1 DNA mismatch repair protein MutS [Kosmotoga sp. DU53]